MPRHPGRPRRGRGGTYTPYGLCEGRHAASTKNGSRPSGNDCPLTEATR